MKHLKRGISLVLAFVLALSLTACGDTTWVYKYDDVTITSGIYLAFLLDGYSQVVSEESLDTTEGDVLSQDLSDGTSVVDRVKEVAKENVSQVLFAMSELNRLGVEMTEEDNSMVDTQSDSMWTYYSQFSNNAYENNGTSEESFKTYNRYNYSITKLFETLYGEGGEKEISVEDLLDYFENNYYSFKTISAPLVDTSTGEAIEESEANETKERLDDYVTQLNDGVSFDTVQALENVATGNTDGSTDSDGNPVVAQANVLDADTISSSISEDAVTQLASAEVNEAFAIETDTYYWVIQKCELDVSEGSEDFTNNRLNIMNALKGEEYDTWLTEQGNSLDMTVNNHAVNYYSPKKLKV